MTSPAETPAPVHRPPRSLAPDLARGLMLVLIALANVSWLLWDHESVGMTPHVQPTGPVDAVVQFVMTVAVDHRAMPLFAVLFGYGMVQFSRSRLDRGIEPRIVRIMLRRRHGALILLGLLHAALLFYGDVLGAYGIAGLLLVWLFFRRRQRTLVIWVGVLGGLMLLYAIFSVISALMLTYAAPPEAISEMEAGQAGFDMGRFRDLAYAQAYPITILTRVLIWIPTTVQAGLMVITPMAILLGWLAARHRVLDEPGDHVRLLKRVAIAGLAVGWLGGAPDALMNAGMLPLPDAVSWAFMGLNLLTGLACGLGYAALFGLLAVRLEARPTGSGPLGRAISAVGQRSLTFYLFQSVVLAPLMAGWGLGLGQHLSTTGALTVAFAVWLASLPIAAALESRDLRGPAEVVLRRLTYGKHDPAR